MNWFRRKSTTQARTIVVPDVTHTPPRPIALTITGEEYFALRDLASRVEDAMSDTAGMAGPDALWTHYRIRAALNTLVRIDLLKTVPEVTR